MEPCREHEVWKSEVNAECKTGVMSTEVVGTFHRDLPLTDPTRVPPFSSAVSRKEKKGGIRWSCYHFLPYLERHDKVD